MLLAIRKRSVKDPAFEEIVNVEFDEFSDAFEWMDEENDREDREFDIISVSLPR